MENSLLPMLGVLVVAAGGLTLVLGADATSPLRRKANALACLVIVAGIQLLAPATVWARDGVMIAASNFSITETASPASSHDPAVCG
jgi:hypothetical protein